MILNLMKNIYCENCIEPRRDSFKKPLFPRLPGGVIHIQSFQDCKNIVPLPEDRSNCTYGNILKDWLKEEKIAIWPGYLVMPINA
jgi:hypothetical protein